MDWIKAFLECSLSQVWQALRERLESDIREYNELFRGQAALQVTHDEPRIVISRTRDNPPYDSPWASLEPKDNHLFLRTGRSAHSPDVEEVRLVPTLNPYGECRLKRGNNELELWQVSRLILEPLLLRR
jgi:hypothetical protein